MAGTLVIKLVVWYLTVICSGLRDGGICLAG
jgi:hypothetical protein